MNLLIPTALVLAALPAGLLLLNLAASDPRPPRTRHATRSLQPIRRRASLS